jgi:hypothetical protein
MSVQDKLELKRMDALRAAEEEVRLHACMSGCCGGGGLWCCQHGKRSLICRVTTGGAP